MDGQFHIPTRLLVEDGLRTGTAIDVAGVGMAPDMDMAPALHGNRRGLLLNSPRHSCLGPGEKKVVVNCPAPVAMNAGPPNVP